MMITIGSDHRGYDLKIKIIEQFVDIEWLDVGTNSQERVDYPVFAKKGCQNILDGKVELGILICGSGIGMAIAANRFKKIYAALCWNEDVSRIAREDDGANVLVLPSDFLSEDKAFNIINTWISAQFKGNEYRARLEMIDE